MELPAMSRPLLIPQVFLSEREISASEDVFADAAKMAVLEQLPLTPNQTTTCPALTSTTRQDVVRVPPPTLQRIGPQRHLLQLLLSGSADDRAGAHGVSDCE